MFTSGAPVSDNTGSKCKIICRIKISAIAGLETERGIISNGVNLLFPVIEIIVQVKGFQ
jgi:hypothetical protein